jgi:hypothetical protein
MPSTELEVLCTWLKCFLLYWNAFNRVGMLSTGLESFRQGLNTFVHSWYAFDRPEIPLYRVGMLSAGLECFLEGWNACDRVGMLSTGLECFRKCFYTFVQSFNAF